MKGGEFADSLSGRYTLRGGDRPKNANLNFLTLIVRCRVLQTGTVPQASAPSKMTVGECLRRFKQRGLRVRKMATHLVAIMSRHLRGPNAI